MTSTFNLAHCFNVVCWFLNRLLTTTISVYRGHSSILEYVVAGSITGALYKCNMGLRGMAVGGGLGIDNSLYE